MLFHIPLEFGVSDEEIGQRFLRFGLGAADALQLFGIRADALIGSRGCYTFTPYYSDRKVLWRICQAFFPVSQSPGCRLWYCGPN